MTPEQASTIVEDAVNKRKQWGKHFSLSDVGTDFLDALVIYHSNWTQQVADAANKAVEAVNLPNLMQQLTLANRQLGAAKSRETKLRKQLADLAESRQAIIAQMPPDGLTD